MSENIVDAILTVLQAEPELGDVGEWKKVNGVVPLPCKTISVGVDEEIFAPYTRLKDQVTAKVIVYAYLTDVDPEDGEASIRAMAKIIRHALSADHSLGGKAATSFVKDIRYVYADDFEDLHAAAITLEVVYYASRLKPLVAPPTGKISMEAERS
ncbi:hypothetical protein SCACP_30200 [Sporomusa carbonis]|uniref:hypothetical protein n=1 Tax=Sporomusa carbonis TaxID=3076075 RepID=UPI003A79E0F5